MTELLETAIARVKNLSDSEQNAIAVMILEELKNETKLRDKQLPENLAESIQKRFAQLGGVEDLSLSREAMREPPEFE